MINYDFLLKDKGVSNSEDTVNIPRHRWYYYKEGYSPQLVEQAIKYADVKKGELVLDPFNGGGTTSLTASIKGFDSVGIEVNPFTAFLAKTKLINADINQLVRSKEIILKAVEQGAESPLVKFSTFSEDSGLNKWLFNKSVLNSFEGGYNGINELRSTELKNLSKLALISSAMANCNAVRDGKCLRYRKTWEQNRYDKYTFLDNVEKSFDLMVDDIRDTPIQANFVIHNLDSRKAMQDVANGFKLCVTSPPYLNTFDYTDIYRPELFLGKFVADNKELYALRLNTVRSHLQAKWERPLRNNFGYLYTQILEQIKQNKDELMHKDIPLMIQAYFEDMNDILVLLRNKASKDAQLWLVVSNSAYGGVEIPVDLILADIGAKTGWFLKEIGVLRYLKKRKTKYSDNITQLRESVVILSASKN